MKADEPNKRPDAIKSGPLLADSHMMPGNVAVRPAITAPAPTVIKRAGNAQQSRVDVLGVVCDFCATAMNKIFSKRDEVAAIYVDLDKKTLSLVINDGSDLSDKQIEKLAKQAGYRIAAIRRDSEAMGG